MNFGYRNASCFSKITNGVACVSAYYFFKSRLCSLDGFAQFSTSSSVIFETLHTLPEFLCPSANSSLLYSVVFVQSLNFVENEFCSDSKVTPILDVRPNFGKISSIFLLHNLTQCPTSTCVQPKIEQCKRGRTCTKLVSACRH